MISKYLRILIIPIILLLVGVAVFLFLSQKKEVKKVHYHAGFVVFKDNKQVNFTDFKYMVVKPCSLDKKEEEKGNPDDNQIEKAHLHDSVGDVVHVERENVKWLDLFKNLNYKIDYSSTQAYLNGKKIDNFQDLVIKPYDSLVVLLGSKDVRNALSKAVTVKHIKDAEKRSENCGS